MIPLPNNVLYYGSPEPLPERQLLRAGPWSATLVDGELLSICWGERELLRRVYCAVRDRNWGTVPRQMSKLKVQSGEGSFRVSYRAEHRQREIDFVWNASIDARAEGTLTFSMEGEARSTFLRNRIGFCLLHPAAEYSGRAFYVRQDDGTEVEGRFPESIAPEQPLPGTERMQALTFEIAPGLDAEIEFSGDIFQMEDQRNWTDATYKTFCTPLSLSYPVEVRAGTRIDQTVTLRVKQSGEARRSAVKQQRVTFSIGTAKSKLPNIGLGMASDGLALSPIEISRLRAMRLSHLRADLHLFNADFPEALARAANEARQLGLSLELALFLSNAAESELARLAEELRRLQTPVSTFLVFHAAEPVTSAEWVRMVRRVLRPQYPSACFGAGTNGQFALLNQNRQVWDELDCACYAIHPQEHAFDNDSLVETLAIQGDTVRCLREQVGELPIVISPVTLKSRQRSRDARFDGLPPEVEVRQMSLFGAAWTVGSVASLAEAGCLSLTYYETAGWRGVMERESGSSMPQEFRSVPGSVFPVYHVLACVCSAQGDMLHTQSSDPLRVAGLGLDRDGRQRVLVANLTGESLDVELTGVAARLRVVYLDERSAMQAMTAPEEFCAQAGESLLSLAGDITLTLLPYGTAMIDEERIS